MRPAELPGAKQPGHRERLTREAPVQLRRLSDLRCTIGTCLTFPPAVWAVGLLSRLQTVCQVRNLRGKFSGALFEVLT